MAIEDKTTAKKGITGFTIKGFNDKPKPCLEDNCNGMVMPTRNANKGRCSECHAMYNWGRYHQEYAKRHSIEYPT